MNSLSAKTLQILSHSGKALFLIGSAAIGVHFLVLCLEFFLIKTPIFSHLNTDFLGTAFSYPMIPILGSYILFSFIAYYLWSSMKKALIVAQEKELQAAKEKVMLESIQRLVGIFAQHITVHNAEILKWVEYRKSSSKQVPESVELSSRHIAAALETLTEAAFIAPYAANSPYSMDRIQSIDDIDRLLTKRLAAAERHDELI
ncbi:MAG: hypothetical protein ACRCUT_12130 [Spirochaetota bacterium]